MVNQVRSRIDLTIAGSDGLFHDLDKEVKKKIGHELLPDHTGRAIISRSHTAESKGKAQYRVTIEGRTYCLTEKQAKTCLQTFDKMYKGSLGDLILKDMRGRTRDIAKKVLKEERQIVNAFFKGKGFPELIDQDTIRINVNYTRKEIKVNQLLELVKKIGIPMAEYQVEMIELQEQYKAKQSEYLDDFTFLKEYREQFGKEGFYSITTPSRLYLTALEPSWENFIEGFDTPKKAAFYVEQTIKLTSNVSIASVRKEYDSEGLSFVRVIYQDNADPRLISYQDFRGVSEKELIKELVGKALV